MGTMIDRAATGSIDGVIHLRTRTSSPARTISTFLPENILPQVDILPEDVTQFVQKAAAHMSERSNSEIDLPVFSSTDETEDQTEPTRVASSDSEQENEGNYDLKPPPPSVSTKNAEALAEQLFSAEHLNFILNNRSSNARFTSFLDKYRPQANPILARYQATQKAKAAIQYANSVAESLSEASSSFGPKSPAAILDRRFEAESRKATEELVSDALPAYVTHRLVGVVTECLVKEITGNNAPVMRDMMPGLAEVYCLTDPAVPDNPIVYASEEFYKTTQYGREYVIGRNCRFLQGPKSSHSSVKRLIDALATGTEVCETILNYRRDGTPFINLLMISPLYDNKGRIRYFLGCQIDVTNMVEGGRGLDSMQQLVTQGRSASRFGNLNKNNLESLSELSRQLSPIELDTIRNPELDHAGRDTPQRFRPSTSRRRLGMEDGNEFGQSLWPAASLGSSGRMPGVYQNYMLVRPYPSLRITFTSPAMRIPGLVQSRFMDRIGGPQHIREGILEALTQGVGVTARISWLTHSGRANRNSAQGKPRWVHCTPLLGSDEQVGVWMMVMVEKEELTGSLVRETAATPRPIMSPMMSPITSPISSPTPTAYKSNRGQTPMHDRYGSAKLYAQYLREGTMSPSSSKTGGQSRIDSARDSNSVDRKSNDDSDDGVLDF